MDEDDFKLLSTDDTIRHLKDDAWQSPDVKWRLDILNKMDKQSTQLRRLGTVTIAEFKKLRKELRHVLSPMTLQDTIDKRIAEKLQPLNKDVGRMWKAGIWIIEHLAPVALAVFIAKRL